MTRQCLITPINLSSCSRSSLHSTLNQFFRANALWFYCCHSAEVTVYMRLLYYLTPIPISFHSLLRRLDRESFLTPSLHNVATVAAVSVEVDSLVVVAEFVSFASLAAAAAALLRIQASSISFSRCSAAASPPFAARNASSFSL